MVAIGRFLAIGRMSAAPAQRFPTWQRDDLANVRSPPRFNIGASPTDASVEWTMWYGADMDRQVPRINGSAAPPPLLTERAVRAWAVRLGVDPAQVGLDSDGYPCEDGEPMGQSQRHGFSIAYGGTALADWFRGRADVFVGMDCFIHGAEGGVLRSVAPDLCVAFGCRAQDDRPSYKLWRDGPPPAFVLEVLSAKTRRRDLGGKPALYAAMGIGEFWLFDLLARDVPGGIVGHRLSGGAYVPVPPLADGSGHRSEALGLDLRVAAGELRFRDPATGEDLPSLAEYREAHDAAEAALAEERARREAMEADLAELRARLSRFERRND